MRHSLPNAPNPSPSTIAGLGTFVPDAEAPNRGAVTFPEWTGLGRLARQFDDAWHSPDRTRLPILDASARGGPEWRSNVDVPPDSRARVQGAC